MQPASHAAEVLTVPAAAVAQRLAQIVAALPDDAALEVLHYAEYTAARVTTDEDKKWDTLFAATTDAQWDALIAEWSKGEDTSIAVTGNELKPIPLGE